MTTSIRTPGAHRPLAASPNVLPAALASLVALLSASFTVDAIAQQKRAMERELREAEARAKQQTAITESELSIQVQANAGRANLARSVADHLRGVVSNVPVK